MLLCLLRRLGWGKKLLTYHKANRTNHSIISSIGAKLVSRSYFGIKNVFKFRNSLRRSYENKRCQFKQAAFGQTFGNNFKKE